jgi:hypothetical protein
MTVLSWFTRGDRGTSSQHVDQHNANLTFAGR